jgi:hypothetical protein
MRKLTAVLAALFALLLLVLFSGCASKRKALMVSQDPLQEAEMDGLTLSLRFLDEAQLKRRFRTEENPFLTQYSRIFLRRIMVFELTAAYAGAGTVELRLSDCEMAFGEKKLSATTQLQLVNYWQTLDKNLKTSRARQINAEKYVLANQSRIPAGGQLRGYLVFLGDLPDSGAAGILVPFNGDGGPLEFSFDFQF